jgi:hypothetical protein
LNFRRMRLRDGKSLEAKFLGAKASMAVRAKPGHTKRWAPS